MSAVCDVGSGEGGNWMNALIDLGDTELEGLNESLIWFMSFEVLVLPSINRRGRGIVYYIVGNSAQIIGSFISRYQLHHHLQYRHVQSLCFSRDVEKEIDWLDHFLSFSL